MQKLRIFLSLAILLLTLLISGCWDRQEMEERNFALAAAIDTVETETAQNQKTKQIESFIQSHGEKKYRLSWQVLNISPSKKDNEIGAKDGTKQTYVISGIGQSLFEISRDMLGQISKELWREHLQTIIISEEAVKESGAKPILDWFIRDHLTRQRIKVFVTSGEARPFLEYQPPSGEPGGIFFANIMRNHFKDIHMAGARTDLGWVTQAIDNKGVFFVPRIEMAKNMVKVTGLAVFKKNNFVGYMDEYAIMGAKIINGTEKSAIITTSCPDDQDAICIFELFSHDTKLTPHVDGDSIYFTLDIAMRGNIGEIQTKTIKHRIDEPAYLHELETAFAREVEKAANYSLEAARKLNVDIFRFGVKLRAHQPNTWDNIKDNWDDIFPEIPVYISVNVTIQNIGEHK